jgi:DNA invertase Pin-like site-specific DNA recombinase
MSGLARELPELEKAIQSANGEGAALVCFVPSDLGRDVRLFVKRMDACKRMGIQVIFVDESGQGRQK